MLTLPAELAGSLTRGGRGLTLLVIRLGALGDIVRTVPPVRLLRRALPQARLFWILEERWSLALEGHRDLDGLIAVPRREWNGMLRNPVRWPGLLRSVAGLRGALRATGATLSIDFHGNLRSGLIGRLGGAAIRVGYDGHQQKEGNRMLTTHRVPSGSRRTPRMQRNLDLIRALGLPDAPLPDGALPLVAAGRGAAAEIVAEVAGGGDVALVSPGASAAQSYKKPPAPLLAAACDRLQRHGITPLVVYGPGEETDARDVAQRAAGRAVLAPPTGLAALAALLSRARLFVGGDSGPLHMACATGCPVLGIYGPTDPEVNRPWGVPHRALHPPGIEYTGIKRLDRTHGFEGIEPADVTSAIDELLGSATPVQPV